MKRFLFCLLILPFLMACSESFETPAVQKVSIDELIFGRFYGMCSGESCVEIYLVNNEELLEDTTDNILFQELFRTGQYLEMSEEEHQTAMELLREVPIQLTQQNNEVYGCPDCLDQGGLHLRIKDDDTDRNFRFDLQNSENPEYLRPYLKKVNEVVNQLTQQ